MQGTYYEIIKEKKENGMTMKEIARELEISFDRVRHILYENNKNGHIKYDPNRNPFIKKTEESEDINYGKMQRDCIFVGGYESKCGLVSANEGEIL
jgi:predicted transcriptional regulator